MQQTLRIKKSNPLTRRGGVLGGCLIALGIVVVIAIGIGIWAAMNFRTWTADGIAQVTKLGIQQSDLPASEKPELEAIVDDVAQGFKDGDITFEQLAELLEGMTTGPLFTVGMIQVIETGYLPEAELDPAAQADAALQLQRLAAGVEAGSITQSQADSAISPLMTTDAEGNRVLVEKANVTAELMTQVAEAAKAAADDAGVAATNPPAVDISDMLQAIVDETTAAAPPATP